MPIFWNFMYEKKKKKDTNPLQQAYVDVEIPYMPEYTEKPTEHRVIIDLTIDEK